ncbi:PREDICTED: uncharacterized protein LOC109238086 [Nicotiana attenuata]|uniref:uncharacterized protein LOC109238086 n=1 Tax=Nicotiana attenuata TaxID=49451 RepID=UPI0009050605|nr:PREDICTED: uncharacterized protein LOC109238086 [Nicotiana attenuata]
MASLEEKLTTLFLKKRGRNLLIVQVYVDDIIFGATNDSLCEEFAKLMGNMDEPGSPVNETMYRGIIRSLLYLTAIRPDTVFSVGFCARFQSRPKESHLKAAKKILRKSTSDMAHFLGSCLISWGTKKQNSVALSIAEAEYVATASCCKHAWQLQDKQATNDIAIFGTLMLIFSKSVREPDSHDLG